MKKYMLGFVTFLCLAVSLTAFAQDKITIKGPPMMLNLEGSTWVYPGTLTTPTVGNFYLFQTGTTTRVCSAAAVPTLTATPTPFTIQVGEKSGPTSLVTYQCYDPTYFNIVQ